MNLKTKLKISSTAVVTTVLMVFPGSIVIGGVGYGLYLWWKQDKGVKS